VVITPDDILSILPDMVRYYDQPEVAFAHVMSFYLSKEMRKDMTVALSGIGPDELFGGYAGYHVFRVAHLLDAFPEPLKRTLLQAMNHILSLQPFKSRTQDLRKFVAMAMSGPERRKAAIYSMFSDELKGWLYTETFHNLIKEIDTARVLEQTYYDSGTQDVIDAVLYTELLVTHEHSLVRDADLSGMAHGLEIRSPFLDHKMIEFAASVPFSMKARGMTLKYLVKKAAERLLPKEIIYRKKMGFGEYPTRWLRNEWRSFAYETLLDGPLKDTGYFQMHEIKSLLDEHTGQHHDHSRLLWTLIMLALWFDQVYTPK
jgi:asparagine synthase (glutamine-hydrolysing)